MKVASIFALGLILAAMGCQSSEDTNQETVAVKVTATGKVAPELVGTWKTKDKKASLDLKKDGSIHLVSDIDTGRGPAHTEVNGKWMVDGQTFYIENPKKAETVTEKYTWKLDGNTLVLIRIFPKAELRYERS